MKTRGLPVVIVLFAVICAVYPFPDGAFAGNGSAPPPDNASRNRILLAAADPFENLTEFAMSGDRNGVRESLGNYDALAKRVEKVLSVPTWDQLQKLVARIRKAAQEGDFNQVSLLAPEAYRTLIEALNPRTLEVPPEVSLLDYAGFKLQALLHARPEDWQALREAGEVAQRNWSAIRPKVTDYKLRDAVDTAVKGMKRAIKEQNASMTFFAAQVDLVLVDLLEDYFKKSGT